MGNYYYKITKVKGKSYLQIWDRKEPRDIMLIHVGPAEKLYNKLVKLENIETAQNPKTNVAD